MYLQTYGSKEAFLICSKINERIRPIDELTRDKICVIINDALFETEEGYLNDSHVLRICEILQVKAWKFVDILLDLDLYEI